MSDQLKLVGVMQNGYGIIPKLVMKDKDLSIEAKAIYAYFCSYAGAGNTAFPSVNLICSDLNISDKRFRKHRDLLVKKGYLLVKQQRTSGDFSKNIYTLPSEIVEPTAYGRFGSTRNGSAQNGSMQNDSTNNNSSNNNSLNNNSENKNKDDDSTLYSTNTINSTPSEARESVSSDQHFAEILKALESILPPMQQKQLYGGILGEEVGQDYEEYGYELQKEAIRKAALAGKSHYGYVHGILRNWKNEGVQTLADVHAKDAQKQLSQRSHGGQGMHRTVEDIMNDPTLIKVEKQVLIQELKERGEA